MSIEEKETTEQRDPGSGVANWNLDWRYTVWVGSDTYSFNSYKDAKLYHDKWVDKVSFTGMVTRCGGEVFELIIEGEVYEYGNELD